MLPLSLLRTAQNHPMLVELKNGETYNGHLVSCDNWMNINLREVICTSRDGDKFWRMPECYVRGSTIKYLREAIQYIKGGIRDIFRDNFITWEQEIWTWLKA